MRGRRHPSGPTLSLLAFQDIITCVTAIMICIALLMCLELVVKHRQSGQVMTESHTSSVRGVVEELEAEIEAILQEHASRTAELSDLPSLDRETLRATAVRLESEAQELEGAVAQAESNVRQEQSQLQRAERERRATLPELDAELERLEAELEAAEARADAIARDNRLFFRVADDQKAIWLGELTADGAVFAQIGVRQPPLTFASTTTSECEQWFRSLDKKQNAFLLIVKPGGESRYKRVCERLLLPDDAGETFDVGVHVAPADHRFIDPKQGAGPP